MNSSCFWRNRLIWSCIRSFEFKWDHACYVFILFLKFPRNLCSIELPLGFDFLNWSLKHVILWVYKCFPENQPKGIEFDALRVDFGLEGSIWKLQILDSRSSGGSDTRAWNACFQHFHMFYSPLERGNACSSEDLCLTLERRSSARRAWISCIQYFYSPLERSNLRSSGVLLSAFPLERDPYFSKILKSV